MPTAHAGEEGQAEEKRRREMEKAERKKKKEKESACISQQQVRGIWSANGILVRGLSCVLFLFFRLRFADVWYVVTCASSSGLSSLPVLKGMEEGPGMQEEQKVS